MKKQILLITVLFLSGLAHAQRGGNTEFKNYTEFKKRTLAVIIEEPRADLLKKLDADQQTIYKQEIDEYNTLIKEAMEAYYKSSTPMKYITRTDVETIISNKDKAYVLLENSKFGQAYKSKIGFVETQKTRAIKEQNHLSGSFLPASVISRIDIWLPEDYKSYNPTYSEYLPTPFPGKVEITYAIKQIVAVLDLKEREMDSSKGRKIVEAEKKLRLKSVTLLINEGDLDPDDNREKFLKAYPGPVEIVTKVEFDEAVLNSSPQYACVFTVPVNRDDSNPMAYFFVVYDCESGKTLAESIAQDKTGISTQALTAVRKLKEAVTESRVPFLRKENMQDFADVIR